jgi:hypothetical protein
MSSELETPTYLKNHEALVRVFGYWPSFHDCPLFSVSSSGDVGTVAMELQAFEYTSQTDERGVFILDKHHFVSFVFSGVSETDLSRVDIPTRLFELGFSPVAAFDASGRFRVTVDTVMGPPLDGSFVASTGEVVRVDACDESTDKV